MSQRSKPPRYGSEEHAAQNRPSKAEGYGASRAAVPGTSDHHRDSIEPSDGAPPTRTTLTLPDKNILAREEAAALRATEAAAKDENARQIGGAIGNSNQAQVDRRNAIADNLDKTPDRAAMTDVTDEEVLTPVESDEERAEREAQEAEAAAEAERVRLEASGGETPTEPAIEAEDVVAAPRKFKLKVNGKEVELTEEQVLEKAQKVASADEYLHLASEAVQRTQPAKPSQDAPSNVGEDDIEDTLTSALMGDKEAIKTIARRLKAPPAVTPDVLSAVDDRLSFRSAVDWFKGEYKDLVEDPMLYRLVTDEDARMAKETPSLPYRDRLKSAGEKIRTWKAGFTPPPAPTPPNPKLQRKASVAPVPQAGGRQTPPGEDEEEVESIESVIDKMARSRHQQGAIRPLKPTQ